MGADDASFAEMRRPLIDPDADPLALDEETADRLLAGDLPPSQVPPGYAEVAALLAATTASPTPEELAGQSRVLAELRAVTRTRRAAASTRRGRAAASSRRAVRPPRRRWAGLAAVALVGALVTGGAAVAASGIVPAPMRDAARSIQSAVGGGREPAMPTWPDPRQPAPAASSPTSAGTTTGPKGPQPAGSTAPGSDPTAGPVGEPDKAGLCQAFLASQDKEHQKKMDAASFERLAEAAGGESRIPAYCNGTQPGDPKPKDEKQQPPGGQGGSLPGDGGDQGHGQPPSTRSSDR
jgi:hypothetical protein